MRGSGWDSLHPQSEYFDKTAQIKGSTLIIFYFHISALQATETMVRAASLPTGASVQLLERVVLDSILVYLL